MRQISEVIEGRPLYFAESSERVRDVARKMTDVNIGAIAVLDEGKLVGVFSERDIMTRVVAKGLDPEGTPISTVMSKNLVVADSEEDINEALQKMHSIGCRHLPVVHDGSLIGMISLRDLLQVDRDASRQKAKFLSELVRYSPDYDS